MNDVLLELAKIGGPVVVTAGMFLWYLSRRDSMYNKTMSNHLAHETESRDKLTAALTSLAEVVRSCPKKK